MTQDTIAGEAAPPAPEPSRLRAWLLRDIGNTSHANRHPDTTRAQKQPWWRVMCLTGVDYFSTLGYQPGIAVLAAGLVSPLATLFLVALTLGGALPVYRRVAKESHEGQGSIAILARMLPGWAGKLFILVLLGFAATDFIITITLSAADASAHIIANPYVAGMLDGQRVLITLVLIAVLAVVFLRGFADAIGIAVALVGTYLLLNAIVVAVAFVHIGADPGLVFNWRGALTLRYPDIFAVTLVAVVVFPKLALGLSGFETGVSVMPLIRTGTDGVAGRIRGAHRLLTTAAVIMSGFLLTTSFATTLLIPQADFRPGGVANGRALAYLAHQYLGSGFGSVYDLSTVLILWFAGASAMAGLLNLVPRYLPRYGLAPQWSSKVRPLVLVFFAVSAVITLIFRADVDAQAGAYATGVLFVITSAAVAVTISAAGAGQRHAALGYGAIALVLVYTTIANIIQRPDGVKIAAIFILVMVVTSVVSRARRATELRATSVELDPLAQRLIHDAVATGPVNLIANAPRERDDREYDEKVEQQRAENHLPMAEPFLFLEVRITDPSDFSSPLRVRAERRAGYPVLTVDAPTIANAIAAVLLHIRDTTGTLPGIYFSWTEGNPVVFLLRYLILGDGEIAPMTREVLRQAEPDRGRRPLVHVG